MGHWRSWLARLNGIEKVIGSSPICSTKIYMKKKQTNQLYEILGWAGVAFVLGSYFLLAAGIIDGNSWIYHALVLAGSVFIIIISYIKRVFQPVVLNVVLAVFALVALIRIAL